MYGSYLLDKHHWPLVFECVKAMTSTLEKGKKEGCSCTSKNSSKNEKNSFGNDSGAVDEYYENSTINHILENISRDDLKKNCNCKSLPLFCKIRICEDGIDSYKATENFCSKRDFISFSSELSRRILFCRGDKKKTFAFFFEGQ